MVTAKNITRRTRALAACALTNTEPAAGSGADHLTRARRFFLQTWRCCLSAAVPPGPATSPTHRLFCRTAHPAHLAPDAGLQPVHQAW